MLADADETLGRLLETELSRLPGCPVFEREQITFDPPAVAEAAQDGQARVNLFLYDVRENLEHRDEGFRSSGKPDAGIAGRKRAPVVLDLTYLVAAYAGDDVAAEHRLLADTLGVLMRFLAIPDVHLAGTLEGLGPNAVPLSVAQPDHQAFSDPAALWQALGGRMRPALGLKLTAPFDPFETKWTKRIREAVVGVGHGAPGTPTRRTVSQSGERVSAAGLVLDGNEQPLHGVQVRVQNHEATTFSDARGFFQLLNLPAGPLELTFHKRGFRVGSLQVVAPPEGRPDLFQPSVLALRAQSDAERAEEAARDAANAQNLNGASVFQSEPRSRVSLSGTLRFANGKPGAFLPVRAADQRTVTDEQGAYCFFDLPPGEHAIIAHVPGVGEIEPQTRDGTSWVAPVEPNGGGEPEELATGPPSRRASKRDRPH